MLTSKVAFPVRQRLELSVVVPAFAECAKLRPVLDALEGSLEGIGYEVIFVDKDLPQGTAELIRLIGLNDSRVRVLERVNRRGMHSALLDGMMASSAPYIAVLDVDLAKQAKQLPQMLSKIQVEALDLLVAARKMEAAAGAAPATPSLFTRLMSSAFFAGKLTDPCTGLYLLDRRWLNDSIGAISNSGYNLLLDLLASSPRPARLAEIPLQLPKALTLGAKIGATATTEYLILLFDKAACRFIPPRFALFGLVSLLCQGLSNFLVRQLQSGANLPVTSAEVAIGLAVMTAAFLLHNRVTYRDTKLQGSALWTGLVTYIGCCAIAAILQFRMVEGAVAAGQNPSMANALGLAIGVIWNYAVGCAFIWRPERRFDPRRTSRVESIHVKPLSKAAGI